MIGLEELRGYFARAGKGILQMRQDRLLGVSLWTGGLPDANNAPYSMGADATTGVQISQPDGLGGYIWIAPGDVTGKVSKSGDTMTGDLTMQSGSADLNLDTYSTGGATQSVLSLRKSKDATVGTQTVVAATDQIGRISFYGSDGTNFEEAARIGALVDTTPGNNDMPGRLVFYTTADGANSITERMRITSGGDVGIGKTPTTGVKLDVNGEIRGTSLRGNADELVQTVSAMTDSNFSSNSSTTTYATHVTVNKTLPAGTWDCRVTFHGTYTGNTGAAGQAQMRISSPFTSATAPLVTYNAGMRSTGFAEGSTSVVSDGSTATTFTGQYRRTASTGETARADGSLLSGVCVRTA